MADQIPMSEAGLAKIKAEIAELERRKPIIQQAIADAREKGDLRENADYHAAREELGMLEAKINALAGKIANAVIIDKDKKSTDKVGIFCTVTFKRLKDGTEMKRTLVGEGEQDPENGKILTSSPMGKALMGHSVGDKIIAALPAGKTEFEILKIE